MPGKFSQLADWTDARLLLDPGYIAPEGAESLVSTPMRTGRVVVLGEDGKPELQKMRWGFSDPDAPLYKLKHMHARAETADTLPTFEESFAERRGILMVETFNEGEELPGGKKRQWVVRPNDRKPIPIAVIWQEWQDEKETVLTFLMLTVPANPLISRVEKRMPAILARKDWPTWLDAESPLADVKATLRTFDDGGNWQMTEQAPTKSVAKGKKNPPQGDLF